MLSIGTIVGDYRIDGVLGEGGMGVVYGATQLSLKRQVALKILRPELARDTDFSQRFRREGRMQASLDHPNVVPVYEAGDTTGALYLAMRRVEGTTLAGLLAAGALDGARALRLLRQVASALDTAHAKGLVHRDVKPQNVLVDNEDNAYLADFGITKIGDGDAVRGTGATTSTGPILGTVAYLAPEVILGTEASPASDRYAFAAIVFECLTGTVLYPRSSDVAVLYAHTSEPPPRPSERRSELPAALDAVLIGALAKDPATRPATAMAIVERVVAAIGAETLGALPAPGPRESVDALRTLPSPPGPGPKRRFGRHRIPVLPVIGIVLVASLASVVIGRAGRTSATVDVPAVPAGAQVLGSDLAHDGPSLDCNGRKAAPDSPRCSIAPASLPGRTFVIPENGAIFSWAVRGASGEISLQIFRERDGSFQIAKSQYEVGAGDGIQVFKTNLAVEAGDFIGIELADGASIGTRQVAGATTKRWIPPLRGTVHKTPDLGPGTGFDAEIFLRVDFSPGAEQVQPPQLNGAAAASAPAGSEITRQEVAFATGPAVDVVVVELKDRVVLDIVRLGTRTARIEVPGLLPGGEVLDIIVHTYEDELAAGEFDLYWVNPSSARVIEHFFGVVPLEFNWFI